MIRATFAGFNTALSALQANQKKLDVTGQNLANMTTEGYTRQALKTSGVNYENPTSFYMNENDVNVGFGVAMNGMTQMRDQFLDIQYRDSNANTSYNKTLADSLDSMSQFLDETKLDGLRASFDNIQTALTNMQDPSKVNDPVYEGELRSRMEATATLFNNTASSISQAMVNEYQKIDGDGSSENGYADKINQLLADIGDLNVKIKKNQLLGNSALELQDTRNQKIDELSSYIPIEVSYFTEKYDVNVNGKTVQRDRGLNYDSFGNATGKSGFPEDLKISLVYTKTDANGKNPKEYSVTLVNGSDVRDNKKNYGSVSVTVDGKTKYNTDGSLNKDFRAYDGKVNSATGQVQQVQLAFSQAESYSISKDANGHNIVDSNGNAVSDYQEESMTTDNHIDKDEGDYATVRFKSGSAQASLDMLADNTSSLNNGSIYRSYDYYMQRLDTLANTFAMDMNRYNYMGVRNTYPTDAKNMESFLNGLTATELSNRNQDADKSTFLLLVNSGSSNAADSQTANNITAATISISKDWVNGNTHIGTYGDPLQGNSGTDTTLHMLQAVSTTHSAIGNRSYADEMNSISTYLANDAYNNSNAQKTNQAVLDSISSSKDQISGVSLDEEAANMMTYVSSYNAAAKLMSSLDQTLQTLISMAG
ncbi:MAG: flagellar basal body protein [Eubacterium sp.]|nr:flagellar basal body protein [Eubacterium sp.]